MKKINLLLAFILSVTVTLHSSAQNQSTQDALGQVVGFTDVVVSDIPAYVATLKANQQLFATLGSNLAGFCQAVSGGVPGEAFVFTFADSIEASLASVETQLTDASVQRVIASLQTYRELTGTRTARTVRPYDGELYESWATRNVYVSSDNPEAYIATIDALERAARANGFGDLSLAVQQEIGSGDTSDLLLVVAVAPSLARMGAAIDAIFNESWAQDVFAEVQGARSQIVDDKFYRCEQIFSAI